MKKIILFSIIVCISIAAVFLLETTAENEYLLKKSGGIAPTTASAQILTYSNTAYKFSLSYPASWTYRNYEGGGGVGFRPKDTPNEPQYEYISISVSPKPGNIASLPFDQYVKVAAINEIQNYQKLASIEPFLTADGQTGYITTWMVQPLGGGAPKESTPIAYLPSDDPQKTIEAYLSDKKYISVFTDMLKTFQYAQK